MTTTAFATLKDGRCPYTKDGLTLYLGSLPITPSTHFAFASAVGATTAALLPFPSEAGKCGKLLDVLREEEGFGCVPPPEPTERPSKGSVKNATEDSADSSKKTPVVNKPAKKQKKEKCQREDEPFATVLEEATRPQATNSDHDHDHFLLLHAHEPLDLDVFSLICAKLTEYAIGTTRMNEHNDLWSRSAATATFRTDRAEVGDVVARTCQVFRVAAFLQCDQLIEMCKIALSGWCKSLSQQPSNMQECILEGLIRKSATLIRQAQARTCTSSNEKKRSRDKRAHDDDLDDDHHESTRELLASFRKWSVNNRPEPILKRSTTDLMLLWFLPSVLIPVASLSDELAPPPLANRRSGIYPYNQ